MVPTNVAQTIPIIQPDGTQIIQYSDGSTMTVGSPKKSMEERSFLIGWSRLVQAGRPTFSTFPNKTDEQTVNNTQILARRKREAQFNNAGSQVGQQIDQSIKIYFGRPVGRGVAGMARATPTFGISKLEIKVGHPNFKTYLRGCYILWDVSKLRSEFYVLEQIQNEVDFDLLSFFGWV